MEIRFLKKNNILFVVRCFEIEKTNCRSACFVAPPPLSSMAQGLRVRLPGEGVPVVLLRPLADGVRAGVPRARALSAPVPVCRCRGGVVVVVVGVVFRCVCVCVRTRQDRTRYLQKIECEASKKQEHLSHACAQSRLRYNNVCMYACNTI